MTNRVNRAASKPGWLRTGPSRVITRGSLGLYHTVGELTGRSPRMCPVTTSCRKRLPSTSYFTVSMSSTIGFMFPVVTLCIPSQGKGRTGSEPLGLAVACCHHAAGHRALGDDLPHRVDRAPDGRTAQVTAPMTAIFMECLVPAAIKKRRPAGRS